MAINCVTIVIGMSFMRLIPLIHALDVALSTKTCMPISPCIPTVSFGNIHVSVWMLDAKDSIPLSLLSLTFDFLKLLFFNLPTIPASFESKPYEFSISCASVAISV